MTYEQFEDFFKKIERVNNIEKSFKSFCKKIDPDSYSPNLGLWEQDLVDIARIAMKDEDDWIGYYIWELYMGKEGKKCITDKDGTKVSLTNPKELYDFMIKYYA